MSNELQTKIRVLRPPEWNDEIHDAIGAFPHARQFVLTGWEKDGMARGANMLGSFANHPELAKAFLTFNNHVASNSSLEARERELLILRTGWLRQCEYEFVQHIILGRRAGITDEEIARIQIGPDAEGWSSDDEAIVRAADELHENARISDDNWHQLAKRFNDQQMLDIIFLVGCYDTVAMCINSLDVPIEPCDVSLDEETRDRMFGR